MKLITLKSLAVKVCNKYGAPAVKATIAEVNGGHRVRLDDLNPSLYEKVAERLEMMLNGTKVAGYAYNSTVAPQGRNPDSYAAFTASYGKPQGNTEFSVSDNHTDILLAARSYVKQHAAKDGHAFGVLQAIDRVCRLGTIKDPYEKMAEELKDVKYECIAVPDVSAAKYYTEDGAFKAFDYKRDLNSAMLAAPVISGWIPCSERMPDDGVSVLAYCKCGDNFSGIYTMRAPVIRSKNSQKDDSLAHHERVTHWMPLPAAPGKDEIAEQVGVDPAIADAYMQGCHDTEARMAETDTSAAQFESLAAPRANKMLSVNRTIETREDAIAAVKELQEKWDLLDENDLLRRLMDKMEERHGEEFNAFFEATVRQIMIGSGMNELRINTGEVLKTLVESRPVRVSEVPGFLVYELVEDNNG